MKNLDVYLKSQIHNIDVYLRELALRTELTAYNRLVIYTQMAAVLLYKYVVAENQWDFSTEVSDAYLTLYNIMRQQAEFSSKAEAFSVLFAKFPGEDLLLETKNAAVMTKMHADISAFLDLSVQLIKTPTLISYSKAQDEFELQTALESGSAVITAHAGFTEVMEFTNRISGIILLYTLVSNEFSMETRAAATFITRYRRFLDMETLTLEDIKNRAMKELVFVIT